MIDSINQLTVTSSISSSSIYLHRLKMSWRERERVLVQNTEDSTQSVSQSSVMMMMAVVGLCCCKSSVCLSVCLLSDSCCSSVCMHAKKQCKQTCRQQSFSQSVCNITDCLTDWISQMVSSDDYIVDHKSVYDISFNDALSQSVSHWLTDASVVEELVIISVYLLACLLAWLVWTQDKTRQYKTRQTDWSTIVMLHYSNDWE
jgi:hypothetical protein